MGMENIKETYLECNNPEVVKEFCSIFNEFYREGSTDALVLTEDNVPFKIIKDLSKRYADDLICCRFILEQDEITLNMDFKRGEQHITYYKPGYYLSNCSLLRSVGIVDKVSEKINEFFKQLDRPEVDDYGQLYIAWSGDDVTYRFELGTDDPLTRYKVEAKKVGQHQVDIKLFKGKPIFEWVDMPDSNNSEGDLPF